MEQLIIDFIERVIQEELATEMDRIYLTNQLLHVLHKEDIHDSLTASTPLPDIDELMEDLIQAAVEAEVIDDVLYEKEELEASIMNLVTPLPSQVNAQFWQHYQDSPQAATDYFYTLSQKNRYIQTKAIAKNIHFPYTGKYGTLEITINLSKPEKDPKAIAKAKNAATTNYPASQLTMTNEGYYGRINHPARSNHRIVRLQLNNEDWGFQYSPYSYFKEHSIFLTQVARPMQINERSFANLLAILEQFPHYFVGSNADLPIVGGSILVHDHYQAGNHTFPMEVAPVRDTFTKEGFDGTLSIVHWPMSVIRLASKKPHELVQMATNILEKWRNYSDTSVDIIAHETDGTPHNTITPIARRKGEVFELDLVLRNNRTTEEYPDGLFHPHADVQPIKKENIGLIEVMGLAILPPRLKQELLEVEHYLLGEEHQMPSMHQAWADELAKEHAITTNNVHSLVQAKVGQIFERVLEDAGVFKQDEAGQAAFLRFVESI